MGFFKSLKNRMSSKDEQVESQDQTSGSPVDRKHTYVNQPQASEPRRDGSSRTQAETHTSPHVPSLTYQTSTNNPPPYESWLAIPDSSQLPPPPPMSNESSAANNASFADAEMGHKWCDKHDIYTSTIPQHSSLLELSQTGEIGLDVPTPRFEGSANRLDSRSWQIKTDKRQQDTTLISTLPVYFAAVSNPLRPGAQSESNTDTDTITFSYSVTINRLHHKAGIAIGFSCKPYPYFRLTGWHRGSLAVHSDDGNRYVNDPYGGIDFTRPLQTGDQIKITMSIHPLASPVQQYRGPRPNVKRVGSLPKCVTKVQVERNGQIEGSWNVHEERDGEKDEGIEGLQGEADLYCAVGVFGMTDFVVHFRARPSLTQKPSP